MSKKIVLLLLALLVTVLLVSSCNFSRPKEILSSLVSDKKGNIFALYQVQMNSRQDIHLRKISTEGEVLWDNNISGNDGVKQNLVSMTDDEAGGIYVVSEVLVLEKEQGEKYELESISINRIDEQGQIISSTDFAAGETVLRANCGRKGIILGCQDNIFCVNERGNTILNYPIDGRNELTSMTTDKNGYTFILLKNKDNPYFVVQKLDTDGTPLWQNDFAEGVRIKYLETPFSPESQIASDDSGGLFISWAEPAAESDQLSSVWAGKVDDKGNWLSADQPVCNLTSTINKYTRLVSNSSGEAVVVWEDHRNGMELYAQKINSEAKTVWKDDGISLCTIPDQVSPRFETVDSGNKGVVVAWVDGAQKLHAQMIDHSGNKKWSDEGLFISNSVCNIPMYLVNDNQGNFIICWHSGKNINQPEEFHIQKIDSEGKLTWE